MGCGVLGSPDVEEKVVLLPGLGLATRSVLHFILRNVEDSAATGGLDARGLAVRESNREGCHFPFTEAVSELSETDLAKFPTSGARMTRWLCKFIRDQDIAPRSRHVRLEG